MNSNKHAAELERLEPRGILIARAIEFYLAGDDELAV